MKKIFLFAALATSTMLAGCSKPATTCSSEDAVAALQSAIREGLEKSAAQRVKNAEGEQLISNSALRAAIAGMKLVIDDVRTTKEDPNSTKKFCTGSLKVVFTPETFRNADKARELAGFSKVEAMASTADVEKGVDYLKSQLDYSVQPTDDGKQVFAEFENADAKLDVFGEVLAAAALKNKLEEQNRSAQQANDLAEQQQEKAINDERNARLEQSNLARQAADQALNAVWKAIDADTRQQLLAQQRAWLKRKDAACKVTGLQASVEPLEQRISELDCQTQEIQSRTNELQGYISGE